MRTTRYGIDPDPITVDVRMAALAREGLTAESFGITEFQLRYHLDASRAHELRELIKQDPAGRAALARFLPRNTNQAPPNGHAAIAIGDPPAQPNKDTHPEIAEQVSQAIKRKAKSNSMLSDDALALAFVERHGPDLRYAAAWSKWLKWASTRWEQEKTLAAFDLARKIVRETPGTTR